MGLAVPVIYGCCKISRNPACGPTKIPVHDGPSSIPRSCPASLGCSDYSQVDILGVWNKFVNFGAVPRSRPASLGFAAHSQVDMVCSKVVPTTIRRPAPSQSICSHQFGGSGEPWSGKVDGFVPRTLDGNSKVGGRSEWGRAACPVLLLLYYSQA